jgi:acid stress chaperone HdeB
MVAADQASAAEEKVMTKAVGFVSALIFALGTAPAARAQVMLDVSKITCEQFAGYKITTPQNIAIWLSGYYNGKQSNTVIDMQKFMENTKALERYCIQNPQILVMKAAETVFGLEK